MKTHNHLFERIVAFPNLLLAASRAQIGKRFKPATAVFNLNLEKELFALQRELIEGTYRHGAYRDFQIKDPKPRLISAAPYRDRVVHHALCNIIEPIFERGFIRDSYACRLGKGTHAAVARYSAFARENAYVLKCDISKYFASIDHGILMDRVGRKIACRPTLELIGKIVGSRRDQTQVRYFPGDDLFTPGQRPRGIPIGNLTSQFLANVYLDGFDHYIKEALGCRCYIRYVDDFVVFGNDKDRLHAVKAAMAAYLEGLRLVLHPTKTRIYKVGDGVAFLGYRVFPTHRLLKKGNVLRQRRRLRRMQRDYADGKIDFRQVHQSIQSWIGHAGNADTYRLRERLFAGVVFQRDGAGTAAGRFVEQFP